MQLSIDLDDAIEAELRLRLQREDMALSDFVREAIREKLLKESSVDASYDLGKDLFGRYASGDTERSSQRKTLLREKIHAKHRGR